LTAHLSIATPPTQKEATDEDTLPTVIGLGGWGGRREEQDTKSNTSGSGRKPLTGFMVQYRRAVTVSIVPHMIS